MNTLVVLEVVRFGEALLFNSDSEDTEDDGEDNQKAEKIWGFAEETIPQFRDDQFRQHFRMSPATFENLLTLIHNNIDHDVHSGHPQLPLEKQLMITVWCLGNLESFRSVSLKFGVTKSTCWDILYRICKKLLVVSQQHGIIKWPSENRAIETMQGFYEKSQIPGIIGAIDGTHIKILKPRDHPNSYMNRKGYFSVLLQGVCDHRKLFIDVFTGVPGSVHDSRLYRMSDLCHRTDNGLVNFPENSHLIGDLAYVLSNTLLVGFKDNGNLNNAQKNFNIKLSKARVIIENAFAYLKGRFRRLKMLETVRLDLIALIIVAACVLHNVCILQEDLPDDLVDINNENVLRDGAEAEENAQENFGREGIEKRNRIMLQLHQNF